MVFHVVTQDPAEDIFDPAVVKQIADSIPIPEDGIPQDEAADGAETSSVPACVSVYSTSDTSSKTSSFQHLILVSS